MRTHKENIVSCGGHIKNYFVSAVRLVKGGSVAMLTIQQLEILIAIEQTGSLRKAADLLYLSQPALSVAIKKMEEELGTQLFVRKSTGLELMSICNQLLPVAKEVVERMKKIEMICSEQKLMNNRDFFNNLCTFSIQHRK